MKLVNVPKKYRFLVRIGRALHIYGVPSYKAQFYLQKLAKWQGIEARFMDLPTWVNYVFYENGDQSYNYIEDLSPGFWNLGGFAKVVSVANQLLANKIDIDEAYDKLDQIKEVSNRNTDILEVISFGVCSASFSMWFRTNWISVLASFIIGLFVGLLHVLSSRSKYISTTVESMMTFIATISAGALAHYFQDINIMMTIISSFIIYIPGLAIATALEEISSRNLVSGTAKFFDSIISLFKQFFGVAMGLAILNTFFNVEFVTTSRNIPEWVSYAAIPLFVISFSPIFRLRLKDLKGCLFVSILGVVSLMLLEPFGALISTFVGAIAVMVSSRFVAVRTNTPKLVFSTVGILMLVPGSKTFIGLHSAFYFSGAAPSRIGEQILFILMGIIGGIMFSGAFVNRN